MITLIVDDKAIKLSLAELGSIIEGLYTTYPAGSSQVEFADKLVSLVYNKYDKWIYEMWCDEFHI